MQDLTDIKIFLASLLQPIIYDAVRAASSQPNAPTPQPEADELLTPEETARLLKVSKVTVWQWSKPIPGILNPRRIGNQVRYLKSEVLAATVPKNKKATDVTAEDRNHSTRRNRASDKQSTA